MDVPTPGERLTVRISANIFADTEQAFILFTSNVYKYYAFGLYTCILTIHVLFRQTGLCRGKCIRESGIVIVVV